VLVEEDPHLGRDHLACEAARLPFQLEHEDRPEHGEIVQLDPVGSVVPVQGTLLSGVELAQSTLAEHDQWIASESASHFKRPEHANPPVMASTSTPNPLSCRTPPLT
jgi:hypothetical protein